MIASYLCIELQCRYYLFVTSLVLLIDSCRRFVYALFSRIRFLLISFCLDAITLQANHLSASMAALLSRCLAAFGRLLLPLLAQTASSLTDNYSFITQLLLALRSLQGLSFLINLLFCLLLLDCRFRFDLE